MKKAVTYRRVSSQDQADSGASLELQMEKMRQYASLWELDIIKEIEDAGISGNKVNRPGFQELMAMVQRKEVQAVIVYSISRFARNTILTLQSVEIMEKKGVEFHAVMDKVDTTTSYGKFFLTMMAGVAQLQRDETGDRTRSVLQMKKERGERVGMCPYGFKAEGGIFNPKKGRVTGGKLVPDAYEQEIIALIIAGRDAGKAYEEICHYLMQNKYKNRLGKISWARSSVISIYNKAIERINSKNV